MHPLLKWQLEHYVTNVTSIPSQFLAAIEATYTHIQPTRQTSEETLTPSRGETTTGHETLQRELAVRLRAEQQHEELLSLLGATLESTADSILAFDNTGTIIRFNRRLAEMWQIPDDVLLFRDHDQIMSHMLRQLPEPDAFLATLAALQQSPELDHQQVLRFIDGRVIECHSMPRTLGAPSIGRVYSFHDVTARYHATQALQREKEEQRLLIHKLEETQHQLLQSEKMASIGQLAAGVAHEINNPIGYVAGNLGVLSTYLESLLAILGAYEAAKSYIPAGSPARTRIEENERQADIHYLKEDAPNLIAESREGISRVKKIVQDLKDFSRLDEGDDWALADLNKAINSTLNIVNNELKYKAEIIKEWGALPEVECLVSQLNQVFLNLLVNAVQAITTRGTITIRTGTQDTMVWVDIEDTGKGIAAAHLNRIFDPFFTTKPVGTGTGLGLSLSYSIIEKHQGRIEVHSELDKGTRFRVWLPIKRTVPPTDAPDKRS